MNRTDPPRLLERVLGALLPPADREELLGQLRERFARRAARDRLDAVRWYRRQVLRSIGPALALRLRRRRPLRASARATRGAWASAGGGLARDVRLGVRGLLRSPGFATVAVVTLGAGIGAATGLFSVVDPLLLRPLPYPDSDRLVAVWNRSPGSDVAKDWHAPAHFQAFRERLSTLEELTVFGGGRVTGGGEGMPAEFWDVVQTSSGLMSLLGTSAIRGRVLGDADDEAGAETVAVLSYDTWIDRFGGDEDIVGSTIRVGSASARVVGVIDPGTRILPEALPAVSPLTGVDVFLNLVLDSDFLSNRGSWNYNVLGRMRDGVTPSQVAADLRSVAGAGFRAEFEIADERFEVFAVPLLDEIVGGLRPLALALLVGVGLVLLISCGNVAMLLLARGSARVQEVAVRRALGASRGRVVRQMLAEGFAISVAGGALGIALAWVSVRGIRAFAPADLPRISEVGIDPRVLGFGVVVSLLTTFLFGVLPALRATRASSVAGLRVGSRGSSLEGQGIRGIFTPGGVVAQLQIALSLTLLVVASLLARSYGAVLDEDPGFSRDDVLTFRIDLGPESPRGEARWPYVARMLERLEALPGVRAAGVSNLIPLGAGVSWGGASVSGRADELVAEFRAVSPGYFAAMGIDLLDGRAFGPPDMGGDTRVAVIDRALRDRYLPGRVPLGKKVGFGTDSMSVVGVVESVRQYRLDEASPRAFIYYPYGAVPVRSFYVAVRAAVAPATLAPEVESAIRAFAPSAAFEDVQPISTIVADAVATRRAGAALMLGFAGIATFLALMGTYGLLSFRVASARREIGLRMALGAAPGQVVRTVARFGVSLAIVGAVVGAPLAYVGARLLSSELFGVAAADPLSFLAGIVVLSAISGVAAAVPARRAAATDPARMFTAGGG